MREKLTPKIEQYPSQSVKKIIGVEVKEEKQIKEELSRRFEQQEFEKEIQEKEIEKTPEQIEAVQIANEATNRLLERYNLPEFNISSDNVHIFAENDYKKFFNKKKEIARFTPFLQAVAIADTDSILKFTNACIHEFIHFKSYQSLQKNEEGECDVYQVGTFVINRKSKQKYFKNLNEAITEKLTKKVFYEDIFLNEKLPESFEKEKNETKKAKESLFEEFKNKDVDNIFSIKTNSILTLSGEKEYKTVIHGFTFRKERKILDILIEKLYSKNKNEFRDEEKIFDLFVKSMLTGKLNWGKLVNKTFGKGTFKKLAQLGENVAELSKFVRSL
ncbi:hypothetical protein KAW43_01025 [Candidatus Parcubacteria bacterium]|nr:hypothetical protein [Candidatus Parcubacteria bacterium]